MSLPSMNQQAVEAANESVTPMQSEPEVPSTADPSKAAEVKVSE